MYDQDTDEQAMAQAMGFSSFGSQNPLSKKRKYNPHADAAVAEIAKPASTGSNSTPLGPPPSRMGQPTGNADEIDLEDEDANEGRVPTPNPAVNAGGMQVRPHGLPKRPAPGTGFVGSAGRGSAGGDHQGRGQDTGSPWYEGYYDPSSNENPWWKLEKSMGLESKGTWLRRGEVPTGST